MNRRERTPRRDEGTARRPPECVLRGALGVAGRIRERHDDRALGVAGHARNDLLGEDAGNAAHPDEHGGVGIAHDVGEADRIVGNLPPRRDGVGARRAAAWPG